MLQPNLVVTGHDGKKSVFVTETPLAPVTTPALAGLDLFLAWGTGDGPISNAQSSPTAVLSPYFPGAGGTRLVLVTWAPAGADTSVAEGVENSPQVQGILDGLLATLEPDNPGMHTSASLDYGIVVAGEMWLELDDGAERHLPTGTCVVQRGTRHRWSNRSSAPATMAFVLLGIADNTHGDTHGEQS